jgi:hypothetical protein
MYLLQTELISMCIFKFGLVRLNSQMDSGLVLCGLWCLRPFSTIISVCVVVQHKSMKATISGSSDPESICDTTLCAKVCQWLVSDRWVSLGTLVYFINKTDRHDVTERLLKMALN